MGGWGGGGGTAVDTPSDTHHHLTYPGPHSDTLGYHAVRIRLFICMEVLDINFLPVEGKKFSKYSNLFLNQKVTLHYTVDLEKQTTTVL